MAHRDYVIWLDERTYVRVDFITVRGEVVSFVVRLMLVTETGDVNVVRYDTAHGMPHRDLLDKGGAIVSKDWLLNMTFDQALTHAKDDIIQNYEKYIKIFQKN